MARVVLAIHASEVRGDGTDENHFRTVYQLWTLEGELICEWDPYTQKMSRGFWDSFPIYSDP